MKLNHSAQSKINTNCQWTYEQILKFTSHQRNSNTNYNDDLCNSQSGLQSLRKQITPTLSIP